MKTQISSKNMFGKVISACLLQIIALNSYLSSCFIQILIKHILNNLKCIWEHFFFQLNLQQTTYFWIRNGADY